MMPLLRANYGDGFYRARNGGGWRTFGKLPEGKRASITCLTGHIPWGLHEYLPQPHQYAVMLREPVARVISLYWFCRRFTKHRHHKQARRHSLAKFAAMGLFSDLDNGMTRWLAGRSDVGSLPIEGPVTVEDLRLAKKHLKVMRIGFVEMFDQSVRNWALQFGWASNQVTQRRMEGDYPMPYKRIAQAVRACNLLDVELYEWARGNAI